MKQGFTLIELAIVLVIVGLLTGGILIGQSMISATKVKKLVRNLEQYEIAVSNFKLSYNQEPGDSNLFTPAGNNNGLINSNGFCTGVYYGSERYQAFPHLSQAGMIIGPYEAFQPSDCGGNQGVLEDGLFGYAGRIGPVFVESSEWPNTLTMGATVLNPNVRIPVTYVKTTSTTRNFFTYADALDAVALDVKIDNGVGTTGGLRATHYFTAASCDVYVASMTGKKLCMVTWYPDGQ